MTEEEKRLDEISNGINTEIETIKTGLSKAATKEQVAKSEETLIELKDKLMVLEDFENGKSLKDYVKGQQDHVDSLEGELNELKAKGMPGVDDFAKQMVDLSKNKDFIEAIKGDQKKEFQIKDTTTSSFTAQTGTSKLEQLLFPGVDKAPWLDDPIYRAINKRSIGDGVNAVPYYEELARTDSAAKIAEQGTYADSAVTFYKRFANIYKIGHNVPVSEEALTDSTFLQSELNDLLFNGLVRKRETELLNGNGTNVFHGIINTTAQLAKDWNADYAALAGEVLSADMWGAIAAMRNQVILGENTGGVDDANKKGFRPNMCFMNPTTITKMKFLKGSDGHYYVPPFASVNASSYEGMTIMESFDIPVNYALIGDFSKANAYVRRDIAISTSDNVASEWLTDTMRMKASTRLAFFIRTHEKFAFVYGDLDAVITDINKAQA